MSAAPFWALDAPDPDDTVCWAEVRRNNIPVSCKQPTAPGSTLCAHHRAQLTAVELGA